MSYTKFSKAVTKWLKANDLPCYGTAYDSPEETKARLDAWMRGSKEILRQWITEKRYRELISCTHGGWYQDDVIFEPLAEHFVECRLFDELRFLCERGIRFSVEDMLSTIKSEKEEHGALNIETIRSTPLRESRTAPLPHRRNVTENLAGIGITISNDTMRASI